MARIGATCMAQSTHRTKLILMFEKLHILYFVVQNIRKQNLSMPKEKFSNLPIFCQ